MKIKVSAPILIAVTLAQFCLSGCKSNYEAPKVTVTPNLDSLMSPVMGPGFAPTLSDEEMDKKEARDLMLADEVRCEDNQCPESVAMLSLLMPYYRDGENYWYHSRCTATLVSPTVLATAAHCVPANLRLSGDGSRDLSCNGQIIANFPATRGHQAKRVECKKINFVSDWLVGLPRGPYINGRHLRPIGDYAFIELKDVVADRAPSRTDFNALIADSSTQNPPGVYQVPYFNATGETQGLFRTKSCEASEGNFNFMENFGGSGGATSLVRSLRNCGFPHGASGAPVLSASGSLVGIIFAAFSATQDQPIISNVNENAIAELRLFGARQFNVEYPPLPTMEEATAFTASRCFSESPDGTALRVPGNCIQREGEVIADGEVSGIRNDERHALSGLGLPSTNALEYMRAGRAQDLSSQLSAWSRRVEETVREEILKDSASSRELLSWVREHNQVFHWGFRAVSIPGLSVFVHPVPVCAKRPPHDASELWADGIRGRTYSQRLDQFPVQRLNMRVDTAWKFHANLTRYNWPEQNFFGQSVSTGTIMTYLPAGIMADIGMPTVRISTLMNFLSPAREALIELLAALPLGRAAFATAQTTVDRMNHTDGIQSVAHARAELQAHGVTDENSQVGLTIRGQNYRELLRVGMHECTARELSDPAQVRISRLGP